MKVVFESPNSKFKVYEDGTIEARDGIIVQGNDGDILRTLGAHSDKIRRLEKQMAALRRDLDYDVIADYAMDYWAEMLESWRDKSDDDTQ